MSIPVLDMLLRSGWVARVIILLLILFSILTWMIIFNRIFYLRKIRKLHNRYLKHFDGITDISRIDSFDRVFKFCPLGVMGDICFEEYRRIIEDAKFHKGIKDWSFYLQNQFYMASERFSSTALGLSKRLDRGVFLLAVISSVAPFLGLLGTVWGIMNSFYEIGNQGSASLAVVAPGIAEALITTIVGLAVAIPSVFFYNIFMHRAERIEDEMDEFGDNLLLRLKRELFNLLYGSEDKLSDHGMHNDKS